MSIRYICVLLIAISFISICGCGGSLPSQRETQLDRNWSRAYETAKFSQILNPEAGKNPEPVVGLDALAAEGNLEKYVESFGEKTPVPVYNINIKGIGQ